MTALPTIVDSALAEAVALAPELAGPKPKGPVGRVQALVLGWVAGLLPAEPDAEDISSRVLRSLEARGLVCCLWQGLTWTDGRAEATASHWALTTAGEALLPVLEAVGKLPSRPVPFPHREGAAFQIVARQEGRDWVYGAMCELCRDEVETWHPSPYAADMSAWFEGTWSLEHGCPECQRCVRPVQVEAPRYQGEPLMGPRDRGYAAECWEIASQDHYPAWRGDAPTLDEGRAAA